MGKSIRTWIFRILVLIGAGLLLFTWFQPWWTAYVVELDVTAVKIFPYGMEMNMGEYEYWLAGATDIMPKWFTPFMWAYLGVCILALLLSLFVSRQKRVGIGKFSVSLPQALIGGVGLSYVVVVIAAVVVIAINAPNFYDAPLQGTVHVVMSGHEKSDVIVGLQSGYWLACAVGVYLTLFAIFSNKIIGRTN